MAPEGFDKLISLAGDEFPAPSWLESIQDPNAEIPGTVPTAADLLYAAQQREAFRELRRADDFRQRLRDAANKKRSQTRKRNTARRRVFPDYPRHHVIPPPRPAPTPVLPTAAFSPDPFTLVCGELQNIVNVRFVRSGVEVDISDKLDLPPTFISVFATPTEVRILTSEGAIRSYPAFVYWPSIRQRGGDLPV